MNVRLGQEMFMSRLREFSYHSLDSNPALTNMKFAVFFGRQSGDRSICRFCLHFLQNIYGHLRSKKRKTFSLCRATNWLSCFRLRRRKICITSFSHDEREIFTVNRESWWRHTHELERSRDSLLREWNWESGNGTKACETQASSSWSRNMGREKAS